MLADVALIFPGAAISQQAAPQEINYTASGQTPEQQKTDEAQCYLWAVQHSGYDPANPPAAPSKAHPKPVVRSGAPVCGASGGARLRFEIVRSCKLRTEHWPSMVKPVRQLFEWRTASPTSVSRRHHPESHPPAARHCGRRPMLSRIRHPRQRRVDFREHRESFDHQRPERRDRAARLPRIGMWSPKGDG